MPGPFFYSFYSVCVFIQREVGDTTSLEIFKARLDGAMSDLI